MINFKISRHLNRINKRRVLNFVKNNDVKSTLLMTDSIKVFISFDPDDGFLNTKIYFIYQLIRLLSKLYYSQRIFHGTKKFLDK